MPFRVAVLAFLLLFSGFPLSVRAQTGSKHLTRNAVAVATGPRGLEAFRRGDWAQAYALFHRAETLAHSPVFLLYMARAREKQHASEEALDLYARVVRQPVNGEVPDSWRTAVEQAEQELRELRSRLAREASQRAARRQLEAPRSAAPRASRNAAFAAGGIGAAGVAFGAVAGIVAWVKLNQIEERCTPRGCKPSDRDELESVQTWSRIADVGFVVGGTGLATSAVFFWVLPLAPGSQTSPMRAGVFARMRF